MEQLNFQQKISDNSRTTSRFTTAGPEEPWSKSKDIKEFPSNAFGKIEFVNEGLGFLKAAKVQTECGYIKVLRYTGGGGVG